MKGTILLLALFGIGLIRVSDGQSCATQEKITEVNTAITGLLNAFGTKIATDSSMATFVGILSDTCNASMPYLAQVNTIANEIKLCPAILFNVTALGMLKFNITEANRSPVEVDFARLLTQYEGGVDEFCSAISLTSKEQWQKNNKGGSSVNGVSTIELECQPFLPKAWALRIARPMLRFTVTDGAFPVIINTRTLCASVPAQQGPSIKMLIEDAVNATRDCKNIYQEAGFNAYKELSRMKAFIESRCADLTQADFDCAVNSSKTNDFKQCIIRARATTGDATQKCKKYECINGTIRKACNNDAAVNFVKAVNLHNDEVGENECSGAAVMQMSMLLVVSAMMSYLYL